MRLLARWLVSAVALMIVAYFVPGFKVNGFIAALIAAAVIGFINATLGLLLKILTFPLTIVTLGLFLIVINAVMLRIAAYFVPGFAVQGWKPAFLGAILLSIISTFLHWLVGDKRKEPRLE
jgi:putative membrane protein